MNEDPVILDPSGKEVQSERFAPCPKCGRPASDRIPSGGFGAKVYLICLCGYDFEGKLTWQPVIP